MSNEFKCQNNVYVLLVEALNHMIRLSIFGKGGLCLIDLLFFSPSGDGHKLKNTHTNLATDQTYTKRREDFEAVVMVKGEGPINNLDYCR